MLCLNLFCLEPACVDKSKIFKVDGKSYKTCAKLVNKFPCMCRESPAKKDCCESCFSVGKFNHIRFIILNTTQSAFMFYTYVVSATVTA